MPSVSHKKKGLLIAASLLLTILVGMAAGRLSHALPASEDKKFETFSQKLFIQEMEGSTLNLHYTLAQPEKLGITDSPVTLGNVSWDDQAASAAAVNYENALHEFDYGELSRENQLALDMLLLYFHTERSPNNKSLLGEVLSPSLGTQAQLPVLLAEYTFYTEQDIEDYLELLSDIPNYFNKILDFEKQKSRAGTFMNDKAVDGILAQCSSFVENPEANYLIDMFSEKLEAFPELSADKASSYQAANRKLILEKVVPAYIQLMDGLTALRGTGKNDHGLCYLPGGQEYYTYLIRHSVGDYSTMDALENRLYAQLMLDSQEMSSLIKKNPAVLSSIYKDPLPQQEPSQSLEQLKGICQKDFPQLEKTRYEVKYVHESLEKFLSPAFYLTPPIDTLSPNTIYINKASQTSNLELFTTLAHEGFPGHLYQTIYFGNTEPQDIRYLMSFGGYVEGWATYIESYAYGYADADQDLTRLLWLNRSINLCLYSLMDVGIHYHGWTLPQVTKFLGNFGIKDASLVQDIFQYIIETPANYLKYYVGYLNFLDLREEMKKKERNDFNLKDFHKRVLEIGPVQFPVLKKHLGL